MISDKLARLKIESKEELEWGTRLTASFEYRDIRGQTLIGNAKVYLPEGMGPFPLHYQAGYEVGDDVAAIHVRAGCLVVNPATPDPAMVWPGENPLARSINLDVALLHIARSLDCIEDTRVTIGGGSAGGWMTWMLTAETFPLAGSIPDYGPVHWGYNCAYIRHVATFAHNPDGSMYMPGVVGVAGLVDACAQAMGEDFRSDIYLQHAPVAHADAITAPVHTFYATSDVLVPIDQVRADLAVPAGDSMPDGYSTSAGGGWLTLLEAFPDMHLVRVQVPPGAAVLDIAEVFSPDPPPYSILELPDPAPDAQLVVCVVEDGPPGPRVGHHRYAVLFLRTPFLERVRSQPCDAAAQLTAGKRRVLDARSAGEDWIRSPVPHLDFPEAERADVERALSHVSPG